MPATRLTRGMLIKMGADLFRVLELQHFTPGNKRGFVQAKLRNIRSSALGDSDNYNVQDSLIAIDDYRD